MPWCDTCDRFYNPNSLPTTAECPGCGTVLMKPAQLRKAQQGKGGGPDALAVRGAAAGQQAHEDTTTVADGVEPAEGSEAVDDDDDNTPVPWHFWILVVALVIYLGWRLVQLAMWLAK